MSFDEWLLNLQDKSPNINWALISDNTVADLKMHYEEAQINV